VTASDFEAPDFQSPEFQAAQFQAPAAAAPGTGAPDFAAPAPFTVPADTAQWSEPRRLHPLSILVHCARFGRSLLPIIVIAVLGGGAAGDGGPFGSYFGLGISGVALVGGGFLAWLRTRFSVSGSELRIDSGVITRQSRTAAFDRIQAIDVNQQLVARLLGLAEVRVQVAGGKKGHFLLAWLKQAEAAELRAVLLRHIGPDPVAALGATTAATATMATTGAGADIALVPVAPHAYRDGVPFGIEPDEWPMVTVPDGRFIGSLALSVSVWVAALALAGDITAVVLAGPAAVSGLVPILLGSGGYLWSRFQRYYGATLSISADGLRLRHGLLNRFAQTIPRNRVQAYQIREPLLWRMAGWAQVQVNVAGYSRDGGGRGEAGQRNTSVLLPVVPREEAFALIGFLTDSELGAISGALAPAPRRAFWRAGPWRRTYGYGYDEHVVLARKGLFSRIHAVVPHGKVQSLHVVQGPWQRALSLSTVRLHSTRGPVRITLKQRDAAEADRFLAEQAERSAAHRRRAAG
jgi:putative membrane protein